VTKSLTAKDTKDAKEEKNLTAKDAKDAKESIIEIKPWISFTIPGFSLDLIIIPFVSLASLAVKLLFSFVIFVSLAVKLLTGRLSSL
jgi:hypothetical protein